MYLRPIIARYKGSKPDEATGSLKTVIRAVRFKLRGEPYDWLNTAATEVNQVWNWVNEMSYKAARPTSGPPKWLHGYDLCNVSSGTTEHFEQHVPHAGAARID